MAKVRPRTHEVTRCRKVPGFLSCGIEEWRNEEADAIALSGKQGCAMAATYVGEAAGDCSVPGYR